MTGCPDEMNNDSIILSTRFKYLGCAGARNHSLG